ncbi:MAG: class I SAM-dependent methyltransferase, partial [Actinomycetia bacterium]|nr:class I SAM-dependent methyltransferase [Actinomycetes bacterium]
MSEQGDNEDDIDLERVARSLRRRVASRRAAGEYPEGLEEGLDEHFRRLVAQRPTEVSTATFDERIRALDSTRFDSGSIPVQSGLPGGSMYHRSVLKAVSRPLHRIAQQFDEVRVATVAALAEASDLVGQLDTRAQPLEGELSAMHARLTDLERQVVITERLADKIDELLVGSSGEAGTTELFFDYEAFEQRFRGDPQVLLARYTELAGLFDGLAPVLDVGCGAGEFLELLRQRQIESFGVDLDPSMIDKALAMGVDARLGDALETLDTQP